MTNRTVRLYRGQVAAAAALIFCVASLRAQHAIETCGSAEPTASAKALVSSASGLAAKELKIEDLRTVTQDRRQSDLEACSWEFLETSGLTAEICRLPGAKGAVLVELIVNESFGSRLPGGIRIGQSPQDVKKILGAATYDSLQTGCAEAFLADRAPVENQGPPTLIYAVEDSRSLVELEFTANRLTRIRWLFE